ncbi:MAG: hypothetical protein ABI880_16760 [Acidobacteriota bacterium]
MTLFSRHLDAATLGLAVLDDAVAAKTDAHLASCGRCRRERDRIAGVLDDARAGAIDATDVAFSDADLARQRQAILQRIARSGGVARVLHFPHGADDRTPPAPRADRRWLLVAAAAGLLLGVAAGQLPRALTAPRNAATVARAVAPVPPPAADRRADDPLLSEVDAVLTRHTRPEFEALDALTPVHYETR